VIPSVVIPANAGGAFSTAEWLVIHFDLAPGCSRDDQKQSQNGSQRSLG
jgi:hypothetical protein